MNRPVTLFTGQWADLPLDELAAKCAAWGFDGLEFAWGDHFEVDRAVAGYRAAEVCDAIVRSSESGRREAVTYR